MSNEEEKAHAIIAQFCDADMGRDEIYELLIQNDISHAVAQGIAADICTSHEDP